ncbi:MAG TPA: hypothetical protein PKW83_13640 [Verrucomicrobiota bacterium]|nr:hypothetical protein [Verrucomicrobiota bacterium]
MKFSLKQVVIDTGDKDNLAKPKKSHYLTVATGLTFQEAKARRNADRKARLSIVPERVA